MVSREGRACGVPGPRGLRCIKRPHDLGEHVAVEPPGDPAGVVVRWSQADEGVQHVSDAPWPFTGEACATCGSSRVIRTGACGTCLDCGSTTACED